MTKKLEVAITTPLIRHQGVAQLPHGAKGVAETTPNGGLGVVSARASKKCSRVGFVFDLIKTRHV
jgi:hypothetical protein